MKKIMTLLLSAVILAACSAVSDEMNGSSSGDSQITFSTSISTTTRVVDDVFEEGDQILVSAFEDGVAYASNVVYSFDSSSNLFVSSSPINYSNDFQLLSFKAAYPVSFDVNSDTLFSVEADQSSSANYELSDLLISTCSATNDKCPKLAFSHVLSSLVITLDSSATAGGELKIFAKCSATIDLDNKSYEATGESQEITPAANGSLSYKVIFAPQTIAAGERVATYTSGETTYEWVANNDIEFKSGYRYSYEWDVNKNDVTLDSYIDGWGDEALNDADYTSIAAAVDATNVGSTFNVTGAVTAITTTGFVVTDQTSSIFVYLGTSHGYLPGDIVNIVGETSLYRSLGQFTSSAAITKIGQYDEYPYPDPIEMSGADMDAYLSNIVIAFVKYTGTLSTSGSYVNVAIDGTTTSIGSVMSAEGLCDESLEGQRVDVYGYLMSGYGSYITTYAVCVVGEGEPFVPYTGVSESQDEDADADADAGADAGDDAGDDADEGTVVVPMGLPADLVNQEDGTQFTLVDVYVDYISGSYVYVSAEGVTVLIYQSGFTATVGQTVTVTGTVSTYNGAKQLSNVTVDSAVDGGTPVAPIVLTPAAYAADYAPYANQYICFENVTISGTSLGDSVIYYNRYSLSNVPTSDVYTVYGYGNSYNSVAQIYPTEFVFVESSAVESDGDDDGTVADDADDATAIIADGNISVDEVVAYFGIGESVASASSGYDLDGLVYTEGDYTVTFDRGTSSYMRIWNASGALEFRFYSGNIVTLEAASEITSVDMGGLTSGFTLDEENSTSTKKVYNFSATTKPKYITISVE